MEPNKKLAREHGTKPGQIAIKAAITQPDLTGSTRRPEPPTSDPDMAQEMINPETSQAVTSNSRPSPGTEKTSEESR
jgi:hypothetical protein